MRTNNENELRNLVMTLKVVTTFTIITNKNIKRKLEVNKLLKISISSSVDATSTKSVMKQLNKKSRSKNSLLSCSFLRSQSSASEITKASAKIASLQETKVIVTQETSFKKKL